MNDFDLILASGVALGAALVLYDLIAAERLLKRAKHDTSRFRLFAVRDRLVQLAVDGAIREDNPAWELAYESVNGLLDASIKKGLIGLLNDYIGFAVRYATNIEFRTKIEVDANRLRAASASVPEFGEILADADRAVLSMCARRTNPWMFRGYVLLLGSAVALFRQGVNGLRGFLSVLRTSNGGPPRLVAFHQAAM